MSDNSKDSSTVNFPVVGIGASAGGLEAIKLFLQGVPEKSGMAYVYVQHLSPKHESALTEILSHHLQMIYKFKHIQHLVSSVFTTYVD